jgi:hypothetical protein
MIGFGLVDNVSSVRFVLVVASSVGVGGVNFVVFYIQLLSGSFGPHRTMTTQPDQFNSI